LVLFGLDPSGEGYDRTGFTVFERHELELGEPTDPDYQVEHAFMLRHAERLDREIEFPDVMALMLSYHKKMAKLTPKHISGHKFIVETNGVGYPFANMLRRLTGIPAAARKRAGEYSMGMRQRLGLAAALLGDPQVLVLDEPSNGLDPDGIRWLRNTLTTFAANGGTVFLSTHLIGELEKFADDLIVIGAGKLLAAESVATTIARDPSRPLEEILLDMTSAVAEFASV